MKPHLSKPPRYLRRRLRVIHNPHRIRRANRRLDSSQVQLRDFIGFRERREDARQEVNSPVRDGGVRVPNPKGLVDVKHVDVVVPGEFIYSRAIRVGVYGAGEVAGGVDGGGAGSTGEVDGRRGVLRVISRL